MTSLVGALDILRRLEYSSDEPRHEDEGDKEEEKKEDEVKEGMPSYVFR